MTEEKFQHLKNSTIILKLEDCFTFTAIPKIKGISQNGHVSWSITLNSDLFNKKFIKKNDLLQVYVVPVSKL